jgi:FKBP-type peptidyl-prolyl cis-trans isomerase
MKVRLTALTAIVAGLFLAASCSKELQNTYATQETYIDAIVSSLTASADSATVTSNKGTIRVTVGHGSGEELREGGAVSFYYAGYYIKGRTLSSDNLFATNYDDFAGSIGWNVSDSSRFRIMTVDLARDGIITGLRNGLEGVRAGEECYVLFSGKYAFGKQAAGLVPGKSALAYRLWIKSISN